MSFVSSELVIDVDALPWVPMGEGAWGKVLRTCPETGTWTVMFKQEAGTFALPHKHLGPADFYVLQGRIEYRGGVATAGHFAREPLNAVHEKTTFPEETIYLFTSYGPLAMYGPGGEIAGVLDSEALEALIEPERKGSPQT